MITVSDGWKAAHTQTLLPETFIEVTYDITAQGVQNNVASAGSQEEPFSLAETLVNELDKNSEKYGSVEWNHWGLDGGFEYYDESPVDPGYTTSSLSGYSATYGTLPTITLTFSEIQTEAIPGITIVWCPVLNEWASRFRVTAYNGTTIVAQTTVTDNTATTSQVFLEMQNYNKVVIEVLEWSLPYHRCRVVSVFVGIKVVLTKSDMIGFEQTESVDLLSAALPKNAITVKLDNSDNRWNPDNPEGIARYIYERQEMRLRYGMTVNGVPEWIQGGTFWVSEWNAPNNGLEVTITARDAVEFMSEYYTGPRSGTLFAIAEAAFQQADIPHQTDDSARYDIDSNLTNLSVDFSGETQDYTIAQILQMVGHVGCCVLYQDKAGIIHLKPRETVAADFTIESEISYTHPEFEISKPLKAVSVDYGDNQKLTLSVANTGEVQTVSNPLIKTQADATRVANAARDLLINRKKISGEYRADPRADVLDIVTVESKYAANTVILTDITYSTTGGGLRGRFTGRVIG